MIAKKYIVKETLANIVNIQIKMMRMMKKSIKKIINIGINLKILTLINLTRLYQNQMYFA